MLPGAQKKARKKERTKEEEEKKKQEEKNNCSRFPSVFLVLVFLSLYFVFFFLFDHSFAPSEKVVISS